jgi:nucleotide-binding universal stress UspA family protein
VLRAGAADREAVLWYRRQRRERAEAEVPRLVAATLGEGARCTVHLADGETADAILDHAHRLGADVVVMGAVSQSGLSSLLLGSTAEKVLPSLDTSLLLVKPTAISLPAHR